MRRNDIVTFGNVLIKLGSVISTHPEMVLDLLEKYNEIDTKQHHSQISDAAANFVLSNWFDSSEFEIREALALYSANDLKYIIKENHLSAIKSKSKDRLIEHIVDYCLKKRSRVFLDYDQHKDNPSESE